MWPKEQKCSSYQYRYDNQGQKMGSQQNNNIYYHRGTTISNPKDGIMFVQHILGGWGTALETKNTLIHTNLSQGNKTFGIVD